MAMYAWIADTDVFCSVPWLVRTSCLSAYQQTLTHSLFWTKCIIKAVALAFMLTFSLSLFLALQGMSSQLSVSIPIEFPDRYSSHVSAQKTIQNYNIVLRTSILNLKISWYSYILSCFELVIPYTFSGWPVGRDGNLYWMLKLVYFC